MTRHAGEQREYLHRTDMLERSAHLAGWLLLLGFALFCAWQRGVSPNVAGFQFAYLSGFAGYLLLAWVAFKSPHAAAAKLWAWLIGAVVLRLILVATTPSDDVHRYLWEGRVLLAGHNPYLLAPDDPKLKSLRTADWSKINHPDFPAIYPPVAQFGFVAVAGVSESPLAIKLWHVLCDVLTVVVVGACLAQSGLPPIRVCLYALNPLVLTAFAIEGHVDSLMLLLSSLSILAGQRNRWTLAGVLFGLAIASKIVVIIWFPWWLIRHSKAALTAAVVVLATYIPFADAGWGLLESLTRFGTGTEFFSLMGTLGLVTNIALPHQAISGAALVLCVLYLAIKQRNAERFAASAITALLIFAPIVHYWYLSWALLWLPFKVRIHWVAASLAMVVYFEAGKCQELSGSWSMPDWAPVAFWSVFGAAWLGESLWRRGRGATDPNTRGVTED